MLQSQVSKKTEIADCLTFLIRLLKDVLLKRVEYEYLCCDTNPVTNDRF